MKLDEVAFRLALTLAGMSLGVNSFFIKTKVDEISEAIRSLSESNYQLRVENAARDAVLNSMRTRLEICETKLEELDGRTRSVEVRLGRR